jgi:hypothetical protein
VWETQIYLHLHICINFLSILLCAVFSASRKKMPGRKWVITFFASSFDAFADSATSKVSPFQLARGSIAALSDRMLGEIFKKPTAFHKPATMRLCS